MTMTQQNNGAALALPVCRYRFAVRVEQALALPEYAGSMLRGAFGRALRKVSCMTGMSDCGACPLGASCPYTAVFETPAQPRSDQQRFSTPPNPYVIEPPGGGRQQLEPGCEFSFSMVLVGAALRQLPVILMAWERALHDGLGARKARCTLMNVYREEDHEPIHHPGRKVLPHELARPAALDLDNQVTLELLSPLRIQRQGRPIGVRELDARTFLIHLARRYQFLCDHHASTSTRLDFPALNEAARHLELEADLRWNDPQRYSSRQQRWIPLGGLTGRLTLRGDLEHFAQLLSIGRWLHVGKETAFGLGHYHIPHFQEKPHGDHAHLSAV